MVGDFYEFDIGGNESKRRFRSFERQVSNESVANVRWQTDFLFQWRRLWAVQPLWWRKAIMTVCKNVDQLFS